MALLIALLTIAGPACDIALESPGGSKAGASYSFTVSSTSVPVTVNVTVGGESILSTSANEKQQTLSVTVPEGARGKQIEIVAENKDGCLISWNETVQ